MVAAPNGPFSPFTSPDIVPSPLLNCTVTPERVSPPDNSNESCVVTEPTFLTRNV